MTKPARQPRKPRRSRPATEAYINSLVTMLAPRLKERLAQLAKQRV